MNDQNSLEPQQDAAQENAARGSESAARPLLFFAGLALLGLALVFVLFGADLFGSDVAEDAPTGGVTEVEGGVLEQVDPLAAGTPVVASAPESRPGRAPEVGEVAPNFVLNDLQGNEVALADFRGQPVIVNFWATWCGPCRIEMPALQQAFEERQDEGLEILAVNREEPAEVVAEFFFDELDLTFTPLLDREAIVANRYAVFNMPTTFFIDPKGTVSAIHRGPLTSEQIDELLAETIPAGS